MTQVSVPTELLDNPSDDLLEILGRPNFTCIGIARILQADGRDIKRRVESEQAHVILFLLRHYLADQANWRDTALAELRAIDDRTRQSLKVAEPQP